MKIIKHECIGCGVCVSFYPELFEIVEGKACIKKLPRVDEHKFVMAKNHCPVGAIL